MENLPGDIKTYYHVCGDMSKAQYTIGYYYTTATTLRGATAENTRRINSDPTASGAEKYALMRVFSMDLYVTNIRNDGYIRYSDDTAVVFEQENDNEWMTRAIISDYALSATRFTGTVAYGKQWFGFVLTATEGFDWSPYIGGATRAAASSRARS